MKKKYLVQVFNFVPYGGKVEKYFVWAFSEAQAKKIVALKFNKRHKFHPDSYVRMKVVLLKRSS